MYIEHDVFFRMLADQTRMRALLLMQREGELCVCELTHALELSQPKVSRHLAQLRESGLVRARRDGLWIHYQVNPALPEWASQILLKALEGAEGLAGYKGDLKRLHAMADRPGTACCA